ncbi:Pycsar system effector family protein [Kitasatospora kifunensis]|uniref:Pycsar effector protein domain-containing protein n=1 Tax=Kitasatospora kifunensis TaxID=58351 RepID=A0A7W7QXZ5_KITKI|nr:Pycsar system effector family protein [Kitasatospora kifunensis]MBB4921891.1 hypothetical protein [Kitasatospora kifunensis]
MCRPQYRRTLVPDTAQSSAVPLDARLHALGEEIFSEIRRADSKAGACCATSLAALATVAAVVSARSSLPLAATVALGVAGSVLILSTALATAVLRPRLRPFHRPYSLAFLDFSDATPAEVLDTFRRLSAEDLLRADSCRIAELSRLAEQKFVLLRHVTSLMYLGLLCGAVAAAAAAASPLA